MIQHTLVLLKPDAVQRGFMGEIITRFERAGLKVVGCKLVWVDKEFAKKHYAEHVTKKFYPGLEHLLTMGPVLAMAIEGVEAIETVRKLVGPTEPKSAPPGTIRGDFAHISYGYADSKGLGMKNLIHASANKEDAAKGITLWFAPAELHSYTSVHDVHLLE